MNFHVSASALARKIHLVIAKCSFFLFTYPLVFQPEIPLWFNLPVCDSDYSASQGLVEGQEVLY